MARIREYVSLVRPLNGLMAGLAVWTGWTVEGLQGISLDAGIFFLMLSAALVLFGGNVLNDIRDAAVDAVAHPERPIPSRRITVRNAKVFWILLWTAAALSAAFSIIMANSTYLPLLILASSMIILASYEVYLKNRGLAGNISVSVLTGTTFVFGASLTGGVSFLVWSFAVMAVLANLSRELLKDISDVSGDMGSRNTLPITGGVHLSLHLSRGAVIAAVLFSILIALIPPPNPMYIVLVIIADGFFISSVIPSEPPSFDTMQTRSKIGMIFALLGFFSYAIM